MPNAADELKRVPLFAGLSGRQRRKLAAGFRERTFKPGIDVVREGSMSGIGFFVVAAGEAAVSVGGVEVARLSTGDHFGELALVSKSERTATVTALTELRCLEIAFSDFREFAYANPDVMWKLLQHVVSMLRPEPPG
jgi:CRP-like cAMP-binding protein